MEKMSNIIKKNRDVSLFVGIFLVAFLIMTIFWISRKGTFSLEEEVNRVVIECPETSKLGQTIECDISLVMVDSTKVYSINANYDLGEGVTYESFGVDNSECTGESCLDPFVITENGFAVTNLDGFVGSIDIGKLRVKIPSNGSVNTNYKVGLKNVELCYDNNGEEDMLDLDDSFVEVRTLNNVATLNNVTSSDTTFTMDQSNQFKFKATVSENVSSINLNYELTDENSSIDGVSNIDLHYGTNEIDVVVTAEDGVTSNTYTISVYRNYKFSTNVYTYNEDNNFIYTGTDKDETIISNLEQLSGGLSYSLNNNKDKLLIKYGDDEILASIDIINFSIDYQIVNKNIYVGKDLTYQQLIAKINGVDDMIFKLFDNSDNEITDTGTIINENNKLKVYYNNVLLDTYSFILHYLNINYDFIDNNNKIIHRLVLGTTYGDLKKLFETSGSVKFVSNDEKTLRNDSDVVKTSDKVIIIVDNQQIKYTLSVLGDINGTGNTSIQDVGMLYRYYRNKRTLRPEQILAGNVINDGNISIQDVGVLYRYYRGKRTSLEVNK